MRHRLVGVVAGIVAVVALLVSMSVASAGTERTGATARSAKAAIAAPKVPNAAAIKAKYGGQSITFIGDSVGGGHTRDMALAKRFSKDTGIKVKVVPHPTASDASYSQLARVFTSHGSSFDVAMIDVVWPGAFAPYLVDLKPKLGAAGEAPRGGDRRQRHGRRPPRRDAVVRRLRDPLLPHRPAEEVRLQQPADDLDSALRDGEEDPGRRAGVEREASPASSSRGTATRASPATRSSGSPPRAAASSSTAARSTINNPKAAAILDLFRKNIGVTTPRGVTSYQEGEAHTAFVTGNAAFMRNWPYAYSIAADPKQSKVVGKFSVTTLPHGAGGHSVGTVGGWQLAVNKYSKHQDAAIEFVRYMTSPAVEKFDAITNTNVPDDPGRGQGSGRREGKSVPQAADRDGRPRHASGAVPGDALQRGLEGHLPGDQPDPQRQRPRAACCRRSRRKLERLVK